MSWGMGHRDVVGQECIAANLARATGSEVSLTSASENAARRLARTKDGFRLNNSDFREECGTTRYHRISILFDRIRADLDRFGLFVMVSLSSSDFVCEHKCMTGGGPSDICSRRHRSHLLCRLP